MARPVPVVPISQHGGARRAQGTPLALLTKERPQVVQGMHAGGVRCVSVLFQHSMSVQNSMVEADSGKVALAQAGLQEEAQITHVAHVARPPGWMPWLLWPMCAQSTPPSAAAAEGAPSAPLVDAPSAADGAPSA